MARAADSTDSQSTLSEDSIFDRNTNIITNTGRDRDGDGDKDRDAVRDRDQEAEEQAYATQATSLDPTPAGGSLSFCKNVKGEGTVSAVAVASGLAVVEESHLAEAGRSLAGDTASLASRLEMRSEYLTASEGEDGVPRLDNMSMIKRYEHVGTRMEQVERGRGREMGRRRVESLSEPCRGRSGRYGFGLDIRVGERDDLTATRLDRTSTARSVDARADIGGANGIEKYGMEMRNLEEMRRGKTGQGSDVQKKTKGHLTERLCKSLEDDEDVENVEVRDGKLRKAVVALVTKERAQRMWRSLEDGGERWAKAGPVLPGPSRLQRTFRNLKDAVERDENGKAALVLSTPARAQRTSLQSNYSKLVTRSPSVDDEVDEDGTSPPTIRRTPRTDDIPMVDLTEERDDIPRSESGEDDIGTRKRGRSSTSEAHRLVRQHTRMDTGDYFQTWRLDSQHSSGQTTPDIEEDEEDYSPGTRPHQKGVLSSLLELYNPPRGNLGSETPAIEPPTEFSSTDPRFPKLYSTRRIQIAPTSPIKAPDRSTTFNKTLNRNRYSSVRLIPGKVAAGQTLEDEIRITVQLASLLSTQAFILQLCRMLMMYGAPGHRLTIYLRMTADVLGIEAHFVYIPGTVLVYFTDPNTHTTEAKLVKQGRGIDLGKLKEVYDIYDDVVHGLIGVEEAHEQLSAVFYSRSTKKWKKLLLYGITSLSVAPFAFQARLKDLPFCFLCGFFMGLCRTYIRSNSQIFIITITVLTSFLARAIGSINNGNTYCFTAIVASSICVILPGYLILSAILELQTRRWSTGSARLVFATCYAFFIGFAIVLGFKLYGLLDPTAVIVTGCTDPLSASWHFPSVVLFALSIALLNGAQACQLPVMTTIGALGWLVTHYVARFAGPEMGATVGGFVIGTLGHLYAILRPGGYADLAVMPAVFVVVPGGLSGNGRFFGELVRSLDEESGVVITQNVHLALFMLTIGFGVLCLAIGIALGLSFSTPFVRWVCWVFWRKGEGRGRGVFSF